MADEITLVSTTDTLEEVQAALGIEPEAKPDPAPAVQTETSEQTKSKEVEQQHKDDAQRQESKRRPVQPRIDELTKQRNIARDEATALRARLAQLERDKEAPAAEKAASGIEKQPATLVPHTRPKPVSSDPKYKTYEEFVEDLSDWKTEQRMAQARAEDAQKANNDRLREKFDSFNAQVAEAREKYDDWDEIAGRNTQIPVPKVFDVAILEFENAADMLYYTVKHPEFRESLLSMNDGTPSGDIRIIAELGRLSDYLQEPEEQSAVLSNGKVAPSITLARPIAPVSTAPAPIKPVGGNSGTGAASQSPDEMDYQTYKRYRRAQGAKF